MRIDTLHRRMSRDVRVLYDALLDVFPVVLPKQYESHQLSLAPFIARLNDVGEPLGLFNEIVEDKEIHKGMMANTGLWIPEDNLPEQGSHADRRVFWHVNPKSRRFKLTQAKWAKRRYYYWQIVMHETIHRYQDAMRDGSESRVFRADTDERKLRDEQHYLGDYDEVEAFAHDAALELRYWYPGEPLGAAVKLASEDSRTTYLTYVGTFLDSPKHPALLAFKRKMRGWYELMAKNAEFYDSLEIRKI